jgi:hypothetical protein
MRYCIRLFLRYNAARLMIHLAKIKWNGVREVLSTQRPIGQTDCMNKTNHLYHGYCFPSEIISHVVWLYHRFCLSFRDVEDLLVERGIVVSYETIRSWCNKFGPVYARSIKKRRGPLGDTWYLDEVYIGTVRGERRYLWRAVDQESLPHEKRVLSVAHEVLWPLGTATFSISWCKSVRI